jgi:prepilin-type N-terminal cleavage/methylation domain-containing protein
MDRRIARDNGFTLIELLIVIVIIGVLASIAIPMFLHERQKAEDASGKADVRGVAIAMETAFTDHDSYPAAAQISNGSSAAQPGGSITIGTEQVRLSPDDYLAGIRYSPTGAFCAQVVNIQGTDRTNGVVWQSDHGGLQPAGSTCIAYTTSP